MAKLKVISKCQHPVMIMLSHPICTNGWICRDCGENVKRDNGYIIGLVAIRAAAEQP